MREFTVRTESGLRTPAQFRNIVLAEKNGYFVRLGEVAQVELAAEDDRTEQRVNGVTAVGPGITRQTKANALEISQGVNTAVARRRASLPAGVTTARLGSGRVWRKGAHKVRIAARDDSQKKKKK